MEALTGAAELFARLSREPDFDAPELLASDATDELLLATAADAIRGLGDGQLAVIGDRHGALTLGAAELLGARGIRVFQDPLLGERALRANAARLGVGAGDGPGASAFSSLPLDEALLRDARVVLLQLPRGLDALDEIAWTIARWAHPEVRVFAGGRVKHMTRAMNDVLGKYFGTVTAGLGWRKSRVLTATSPRAAGDSPFPRWGDDAALPFRVAAFGATFGGPTLDHGSRLLLNDLASAAPDATRIVDLGSGNGVLATAAALSRPAAHVLATDQSAAAALATAATAAGAGVLAERCDHEATDAGSPGVCVCRADALETVPDGWAELILLNPPFHTGATVHAGVAHRLIAACARALAPGGELRLVFNTHLQYRSLVERVIGPTRQIARDRTFTVLASQRR